MPTVQQQTASSAFHIPAAGYRDAGATRPVARPAPTPDTRPKAAPAARTRRGPQTVWLLLITLLAMAVVATGLAYLSGHAQVAHEGYRHVALLGQKKAEYERNKLLKQRLAEVNTAAYIEQKAAQLGMVRADPRQRFVIPEER